MQMIPHLLITANSAWNIAHFRAPILSEAMRRGWKITVVAPIDHGVNVLQQLGCQFEPLVMDTKGLNVLQQAMLLWRMRQIILKNKPSVILSYTIKNNIAAAIIGKLLRIPVLPNVSGLGTAFLSGPFLRRLAVWASRAAFQHSPAVFFQNPEDMALFVADRIILEHQAKLVPGSGINLSHFRRRPRNDREKVVFLMIARVIKEKGVREYVKAASIVAKQCGNVEFRLMGPIDVESRGAIPRAEVEEWKREGIVHYIGERSDVRDEIAAADCIVLPSWREGAPRTLIEAAAMGRPSIASDVPGCRQVVENGRTGLLCPPRDALALAAVLKQFIDMQPKHVEGMCVAAREKAEREFDERLVVQEYFAVLDGIVDKR